MTIISEIPPSSFFFEIPAEMRGFFIDFFKKNNKKLLTIPLISGIIKTRKAKKGIPHGIR